MTRHRAIFGVILALISTLAAAQTRSAQVEQPGVQQPGMRPGARQAGSQNPDIGPPEVGSNQNLAGQTAQQQPKVNGGTLQQPDMNAGAPASSGAQTGQAVGSTTATQGGSMKSEGEAETDIIPASNLAGQIEAALRDDAALANDHLSVTVGDTEIVLSGTVGSGKEKETARRIAESFTNNRKLVDKLKVSRGKSTGSDQSRP